MVATVQARGIAPLFDYLRAQGMPPEPLVADFGLELSLFDDLSAAFPVSLAERLWERAAAYCGDEQLGLHVAARVETETYGLVTYLTAYSRTFGAALERLTRYFGVLSSGLRYRLRAQGDRARFFADLRRPCSGRQVEELAMAVVVHFARKTVRGGLPRRAGRPAQSAAAFDRRVPRSVRHDTPCFNATETYIELDAEVLELPLEQGNDKLARLLEPAAKRPRTPATSSSALHVRVVAEIADALAAGRRPETADLAARMGMSPRTLRRHLAREGYGFRGVQRITRILDTV